MINSFIINGTEYRRFDEKYFVTSDGIVAMIQFDENGELKKYFRVRSEIGENGYVRVKLHHRKFHLVHRIVYSCLSGESLDPRKVIDHKDSNPRNNSIDNLQQVSQQENIALSVIRGNHVRCGNKKIRVIDKINKTETEYDAVADFLIAINAPKYMIDHGGLSMLNKRKDLKNRYEIHETF